MKERLSKVYLDDYPITLMGDEATPPLSRIVRAGGKRPDDVDVVFLTSPSDGQGRPVEADEIIDRAAEPTRPIYLRTIAREGKPIHTADPGHALSRPDVQKALGVTSLKPDVDPVIAQLGGPASAEPLRPVDRGTHEEAVFRSPSQLAQLEAESEAEQRKEDERNQEDALQDEQEARQQADEDESQT